MKIRNGFVSNSSSSSYIISISSLVDTDEIYNVLLDCIRSTSGDWLTEIKDNEIRDYVDKFFEENCIKFNRTRLKYSIEGFSSMHNGYSDMPEILKVIYFELLEKYGEKYLEFKRDSY